MASSFINIPESGSPSWKDPVPNASMLPPTGNSDGDARVAIENDSIYIWSNNQWNPITGGGGGGAVWGNITGSLSNQTDLEAALGAKQNTLTIGNLTDIGTDGIVVGNGTGAVIGTGTTLSQHVADSGHNGYLASVDWVTFNAKQSSITAISPLNISANSISIVQSGTSTSGYLSSTDWNTFNNKGSGSATSVGLAELSTTPIYTITNSPVTTSGTLDFTLKSQSANKIFAGPTSGNSQPTFRSLSASDIPTLNYVTSVALSAPSSVFSISGSPVTTSGTLTLGLQSQSANKIWAGPSSGSIATPSFRGLVAADIPTGTIAARSSFVFQPGGTASGNVYTSWSALYNDLSNTKGQTFIFFDNSFTDVTIPAGSYPNINAEVTFSSYSTTGLGILVNIANGVTFGDLPVLFMISLNSDSSSPIVSVSDGSQHIFVLNIGSGIQSSTSPMISLSNGSGAIMFLSNGSTIGNNGSEAIGLSGGSSLFIFLGGSGNVNDDVFADDGTTTVLYFFASASAVVSITQPAFTGALTQSYLEQSTQIDIAINDSDSTVAQVIYTGANQYETVVASTGGNHTVTTGFASVNLNATGTLTSYTVSTDVAPIDGQFLYLTCNHIISTFTLTASTGAFANTQPTTLTAGQVIRLQWDAESNLWWNK